ncbi:Cacybp [Symbiodinium sp. KB8]|nr:Cacybp [Symbiodinium sp. KB8]
MAVEDLTTDLRAHLTDTVGLDLRHDALSEREVLFASILGLMRAQTLSSTVLCPVIHRFPEQLCGSWSATPEGQRAKVFLDAGGDAMDENKMWQLMLYTWLGAGGVSGLPWKHILATDGLTHYEPSSDQAMAVVKFAMLYTQCRGNHVLKFFGSDGRDKGLRFSQDKFLMLKAWHASVPALTAALNFNTASFVSKMRDIDGFGELAVKEVLSYLGVSGHERFRTMAFQFIPFGPGAKNGASLFFGCTRKLLQLATNLQPHIQEYLAKCFPTVEPGVTVVDIEIFLCYGYTYCKMVQQLRSGSGTYKVPAGWSPRDHKSITPRFDGELTTREAVPHRHLQTPWHLASFWGFQSLAKHFGQISAKRAKKRPAKDRPRKKGRTAMNGTGAASSAAAPRNSDPRLRRDDKDVNTYYQAWDQVNVDRALVAEDGMDPNVVPENIRPLADFGDLDRQLDMSTKISRFSWDQSDRFVSIYVPFDGAGKLKEEDVQVHFREIGVLLVFQKDGKRHWYKVPNLCQPIDVEASKRTIKADQVVVKLRKARVGSWSDLTDEKDRYQRKREYRIQHGDLKGATTEELLADMYKNASDEDRAGLRDAMRVNREKREEDARKAAAK